MDVLRSALVLLGILAVTGCHHGYHRGGSGWYDPGYGACVPPEDGYYSGWALPPAPWDMDPKMSRRDRRHRSRHGRRGEAYPPYGPAVMPYGAPCDTCGVCDSCGVAGGPGMVVADGMMVGGGCPCENGGMLPGEVIPGEVFPGEYLPGTVMPEMTMPGAMMPGTVMPPQAVSGHCENCQQQHGQQHVHPHMQPTPDNPPPAPAAQPTPNCAHCNETTQWQQFPSTAPAVPPVDDYYVPSSDRGPSTNTQAPAPLPRQQAGEPVQPVMWVPSSFDGR